MPGVLRSVYLCLLAVEIVISLHRQMARRGIDLNPMELYHRVYSKKGSWWGNRKRHTMHVTVLHAKNIVFALLLIYIYIPTAEAAGDDPFASPDLFPPNRVGDALLFLLKLVDYMCDQAGESGTLWLLTIGFFAGVRFRAWHEQESENRQARRVPRDAWP